MACGYDPSSADGVIEIFFVYRVFANAPELVDIHWLTHPCFKVSPEIVVCRLTFYNNLEIEDDFRKYLRKSC